MFLVGVLVFDLVVLSGDVPGAKAGMFPGGVLEIGYVLDFSVGVFSGDVPGVIAGVFSWDVPWVSAGVFIGYFLKVGRFL